MWKKRTQNFCSISTTGPSSPSTVSINCSHVQHTRNTHSGILLVVLEGLVETGSVERLPRDVALVQTSLRRSQSLHFADEDIEEAFEVALVQHLHLPSKSARTFVASTYRCIAAWYTFGRVAFSQLISSLRGLRARNLCECFGSDSLPQSCVSVKAF